MYNNHFFRVFSQIQTTVNSSEIAKNVTVMCILTAYTVAFIYQTEFTVNFQNILFCFFSVCYNIIYDMLKKSALGVFICIFWLSRTKGLFATRLFAA